MRLAVINYNVINEWSEVKQNTTVILVKKKKKAVRGDNKSARAGEQ